MLSHKAYNYRIYPTKEQESLLRQTFGSCRFIFNHFLTQWNDTYATTGKGLSYHACAIGLPSLKDKFWMVERR